MLLVNKLKNSIGLKVILFTSNSFRFEGKILGIDEEAIQNYIGFELDKEYFDVSNKRIEEYKKQEEFNFK